MNKKLTGVTVAPRTQRSRRRRDREDDERRENEPGDQPDDDDRKPLRAGEEPGPGPGVTDHQRSDCRGKRGLDAPGRPRVIHNQSPVDRSLGVAVQERVEERSIETEAAPVARASAPSRASKAQDAATTSPAAKNDPAAQRTPAAAIPRNPSRVRVFGVAPVRAMRPATRVSAPLVRGRSRSSITGPSPRRVDPRPPPTVPWQGIVAPGR